MSAEAGYLIDADASLDDVERAHITAVLARHGWNHVRTSRQLRISPKTLSRKIRRYCLVRPAKATKTIVQPSEGPCVG
jgi:DNA-binding NtrC family response regulator